jgi:glycerophosphoryl diester phosphodiesterase family protein/uncharacterized protein DUF4339
MYKIIGADQKEYGPVPPEQVRQWIAEGRASRASLIRPEGSIEWQPLASFPEFADVLDAVAPAPAFDPAHGPQIGLSYEVLSRDYHLNIGLCIGNAWALLKENFGMIFGGVTIFMLVHLGISALAQIPIIGVLLGLGSIVIGGPLTGGLYLFLLNNIRHQRADIGDVFSGFGSSFGQLVLGYLIPVLLIGASMLPGAGIIAYPIFLMAHRNAVTAPLLLCASVGLLIAIIPLVYLSVSWIFTLPLIIDRQTDFWTAMAASRKMVTKHWAAVFALLVVCGLINVVGFGLCFVGFFVSLPITLSALMYAYESIFSTPAPTSA